MLAVLSISPYESVFFVLMKFHYRGPAAVDLIAFRCSVCGGDHGKCERERCRRCTPVDQPAYGHET